MITEGAKSYTFNAASQLKSMTGPSGSQGTYRFDAMGNRVKRTWNYQSGSTWSGSLIAIYGPGGELLTEYKNETNSVYGETTTTYHIQMSGQTVARRVIGTNIYGGPASRTEWLHRNHLNQVVAVDSVNDSNQSVFGRIAGYSQPYNSGGSDQFQGHKDDPETSLHYNLARSYSPGMARWISADPVTSRPYNPKSLNKYAYVRTDPVNSVDRNGLEEEPTCGGTWSYVGFGEWDCILDPVPDQPRMVRPTAGFWRRLFGRETFDEKVNRALNTLESKLSAENISDDCKALFQTLGVDPQEYRNRLDTLLFWDGTLSDDKIQDVISQPYARATGTLGWTVADLFANNFPGSPVNTRIVGWTPPEGPNVYLRPGSTSADTIGHELFHKFKLNDPDLLRPEWGLNPNGVSSQFNDYFKKKCL